MTSTISELDLDAMAVRPVASTFTLDQHADASDILVIAFRSMQSQGREPFVHTATIGQPVALASLLPSDATVERCVTTDTTVAAVARCPRGSMLILVGPSRASVEVSATSDAAAEGLLAEAMAQVPVVSTAGTVPLRTWLMSPRGDAYPADRDIEVPVWADIARNYPAAVGAQLDQLMHADPPTGSARLLLWHGDPGTGKTTAVRALLEAWAPWCHAQYIADPERLFMEPGYITDVLTHSASSDFGPTLGEAAETDSMWRLIIAEDCDEYLRASARHDAGAGLGRLLNLSDGLLGQGYRVLILLTTNEELHRLHPALVRPGRCLARVEFRPFSPAEARQWLPEGIDSTDGEVTLADLFERTGAVQRIGTLPDAMVPTGVYL